MAESKLKVPEDHPSLKPAENHEKRVKYRLLSFLKNENIMHGDVCMFLICQFENSIFFMEHIQDREITYFKSRTLCFFAMMTPLLGPESLNILAAVTQ